LNRSAGFLIPGGSFLLVAAPFVIPAGLPRHDGEEESLLSYKKAIKKLLFRRPKKKTFQKKTVYEK
jgi:hypothetical protein